MNTAQRYVGRANNAPTTSQTVETRRFAPLTPDERKGVTEQLNAVEKQLFGLVDDFASIETDTDPVSVVADLLQDVISLPDQLYASSYTRDRLKTGLQLIAFLSETRLALYRRGQLTNFLESGKEVGHE